MVKIGNIELLECDVEKCYNDKLYVCSYTGIYQVHYSQAQQKFYGTKVIDYKGYARRGRFYLHDADTVNSVFGQKILL